MTTTQTIQLEAQRLNLLSERLAALATKFNANATEFGEGHSHDLIRMRARIQQEVTNINALLEEVL